MCQLEWAMGYTDILVTHYTGSVCVMVFLDEINIQIGRLTKGDCPP